MKYISLHDKHQKQQPVGILVYMFLLLKVPRVQVEDTHVLSIHGP